VAATPVEAAPAATSDFQQRSEDLSVPDSQSALLLHAIRTPYDLKSDHTIPSIQHDHELLIRVSSAGLNPIDWKAPQVQTLSSTQPI
jgi:hypothetical protein